MSIEKYNELAYDSLGLQDEAFLHQHIIDAYTSQIADPDTKKISLTFALVGLYLFIEKDYTGKEVQKFHTLMSNNKLEWPDFILPKSRGKISIEHVLECAEGDVRNKMIKDWCKSIWHAYSASHSEVKILFEYFLNIEKKSNR